MFYRIEVVNVDDLSMTYRNSVDKTYIDADELRQILEGCDYLYIYCADDRFSELYGELFEGPDCIDTSRAIYSLDKASGKYELISNN